MERRTITVEVPNDPSGSVKVKEPKNRKKTNKKQKQNKKNVSRPESDNNQNRKLKPTKKRHSIRESYAFRRFVRFIKTLAIIAGCVAAAVGLLFVFVYFFCTVENVTVTGSNVYSQEEIEAMVLDDEYSWNSVYVLLDNFFRPKKNIEFVKSETVYMSGLHDITIAVEEKDYRYFINMGDGTYTYVDADGKVLEITDRFVELPELFLQTYGEMKKGKPFSDDEDVTDIYAAIVEKLEAVDTEFPYMYIDDDGNGYLVRDNVTISLGDTDDIAQKMRRIDYIYPYIEGMTGTLHMENWSASNTDIIFERTDMPKVSSLPVMETEETEGDDGTDGENTGETMTTEVMETPDPVNIETSSDEEAPI